MAIDLLKFVIIVVLSSMILYTRTKSVQSIMKYTTIVIYLLMFYSYFIYIIVYNFIINMDFYLITFMLSVLLIFINLKYTRINDRIKDGNDMSFEDLLIIFTITVFYLIFKSNVITYDTLAFFIPLSYDMIHHPSVIPQSSVFGTDTPLYPYFISLLLYPGITANMADYKIILQIAFYIYILNMIFFGYKFVIHLMSNGVNLNKKQTKMIALLYIFILLSTPYFYRILTQYYLHPSILLSYFFLVIFERFYIHKQYIKISDIFLYVPLALSYDSMLLAVGLFVTFNVLLKIFAKCITWKSVFAIIYIALILFIMIRNFQRYDFVIRLSSYIDKYIVIVPSLIIFLIIGLILYKKGNTNIVLDLSLSKSILFGVIMLVLILPYLINYTTHVSIYDSLEYAIWQQTIASYTLIEFIHLNIAHYYYYFLFVFTSVISLIFKKNYTIDLICLLIIFTGTFFGLLLIDPRRFVFVVHLILLFLLSLLSFKVPKFTLLIIFFITIFSFIFNSLIYPVSVIRQDIHLEYYNEIVNLLRDLNCSKIFYFNLPFIISYSYYSNNTFLTNHIVPYDLIRFEFYYSLSKNNYTSLFMDNSCLVLSKYQTNFFDKLYTVFYSKYFIISRELSRGSSFLVYGIKSN
jgi:hypothetical protein